MNNGSCLCKNCQSAHKGRTDRKYQHFLNMAQNKVSEDSSSHASNPTCQESIVIQEQARLVTEQVNSQSNESTLSTRGVNGYHRLSMFVSHLY